MIEHQVEDQVAGHRLFLIYAQHHLKRSNRKFPVGQVPLETPEYIVDLARMEVIKAVKIRNILRLLITEMVRQHCKHLHHCR